MSQLLARFCDSALICAVASVLLALTVAGGCGRPADTTWLQVELDWDGASPNESERQLAEPAEAAVQGLPGIEPVYSISRSGGSSVWLKLARGAEPFQIQGDVSKRIEGLEWPPAMFSPAVTRLTEGPILLLAFHGPQADDATLQAAADTVARRLQQTPNIGHVWRLGPSPGRLVVAVDPDRLAAYGLTFEQVRSKAVSRIAAAGRSGDRETAILQDVPSAVELVSDTNVLTRKDAAPVRVRDVASVALTTRRSPRVLPWPRSWRVLAVQVPAAHASQCAAAVFEIVRDRKPHQGVEWVSELREQEAVLPVVRQRLADRLPPVVTLPLGRCGGLPCFNWQSASSEGLAWQVSGPDWDSLRLRADEVSAALKNHRDVAAVTTLGGDVEPELRVQVKRDAAAELGITAAQVAAVVSTAYEPLPVARYIQNGRMTDIVVRQGPPDQRALDISTLKIHTPTGDVVKLSDVAAITIEAGPTELRRAESKRYIELRVLGKPDSHLNATQLERHLKTLRAKWSTTHPDYQVDLLR